MNKLILLVLITVAGMYSSYAQLLLSQGQSFTYSFLDLQDFGDGHPSPFPRGVATFYTDPAQSSQGATYRIDLFENDVSETPIGSIVGSGNLTASSAANGWQDLTGVARVTVTSGDVYFDELRINVYRPDGLGAYQLYTSDLVPVPEPGTVSLLIVGAVGLLGWTLRRRRS